MKRQLERVSNAWIGARAENSALSAEANTAYGLMGSRPGADLVSNTNPLGQSNHRVANGQHSRVLTNYYFAKFSAFTTPLIKITTVPLPCIYPNLANMCSSRRNFGAQRRNVELWPLTAR